MVKSWFATAAAVVFATAPLTAQFTVADYAARRDSVAARIDSGVVIGFGGRTLVTDFSRFFQLASFHYLTGYDEPDGAMIMVVRHGKAATTMFVTQLPARTAFYYGQRADTSELQRTMGVSAHAANAITRMADSLAGTQLPFYTLGDYEDNDFRGTDSLTRGQSFMKALILRHPGLVPRDAQPIVAQLRAHKSAAEIALLRKAAEISSEGHRAVLTMPQPKHEYEMQAVLESTFLKLGGERPAYGSIVGSGEKGTQLHYMLDRGPANPGDIVVIDAATQVEGYAADVTRSIPVSGRYTAPQKALYELVLKSQAAAERNSRAGMSRSASADSSFVIRAHGLAMLGLVASDTATYDPPGTTNCTARGQSCLQANLWMIHGISHGLGLAVHDFTQGPNFAVGDVFTIEPGIYISSKMLDVLPDTPRNRAFIARVRPVVAKYDMTGIRIEDDYAITEKGLERLSTAPRDIAEIEAIMARRGVRQQPVRRATK